MASDGTVAAAVPQRTGLGIAFLVGGIAVFSIQDVVVKELSPYYSVSQFVLLRTLFSILPILALVVFEGGLANLRFSRPKLHILRGTLLFLAYVTYFMAIASVPLATAVALFLCSPLIVAALAALLLKEKVGIRRWLAVIVGLCGVLLILRPGSGAIEPGLLIAVVPAVIYACTIILTRKLSSSETGISMVVSQTFVYLVLGIVFSAGLQALALDPGDGKALQFLLGGWRMPEMGHLGLIALCGIIAAAGFYGITQGYRMVASSVAAPFEYTGMLWGLTWGYLFWAEIPSSTSFVGMAVIVAAGLYIIPREALRNRQIVSGKPLRQRT